MAATHGSQQKGTTINFSFLSEKFKKNVWPFIRLQIAKMENMVKWECKEFIYKRSYITVFKEFKTCLGWSCVKSRQLSYQDGISKSNKSEKTTRTSKAKLARFDQKRSRRVNTTLEWKLKPRICKKSLEWTGFSSKKPK